MVNKTNTQGGAKLPLNQIIDGDCIEVMNSLPENSVICTVRTIPRWMP